MRHRIAFALALAACGGKSQDKPAEAPPEQGGSAAADPAPSFDQLRVEVAGKPVAMHHAYIKRVSPDHWRLQINERGGSCDELLSGATTIDPATTTVIATIRKLVSPNGFEAAFVTDFYVGGKPVDTATGTPIAIGGPVDRGAKVDIDLSEIVDPASKLELGGKLVADGCGDQPVDAGVPKAAHPSTATITIAGKPLALHGAVLGAGDGVLLTTGPKDCTPGTPFAQVVLERAAGAWKLSGTWIGGLTDQTADMKGLVVEVGKPGTSPDGPIVPLTLKGTGKIGGYTLAVAGTIEALDCPH